MNKFFHAILSLLLVGFGASAASAREQLRIVGSSTVFPFVAAAAEQFGRAGTFRTPIVEATGTGGGIKMFCQGTGENFPDMVNASRAIKLSEIALCKQHGIADIIEVKLGFDGIVLANARASESFALTRRTLFLALAREIPKGGKLIANPYIRWREIDPALPNVAITLYGPPPSSGTRDAFVELVMEAGCDQVPEMETLIPDEKKRKQQCAAMREDGVFVEAGEDDNLIVQKLINNPAALGIFGYSFLENNAAHVKANPIDAVMPSYDAIEAGDYQVARSLYIYAKRPDARSVLGSMEFLRELTSDAATGSDGYLALKGLLPLGEAEHEFMKRMLVEKK